MDFLFVVRTPSGSLGLSTQADSSIFAGWELGPRATWPMKVICLTAIWLQISGILNRVFRIVLLEIFSSFTCRIEIPRILRILLWRNTSNLLSRLSLRVHDSHPHNSRFMGMARKIRCLARVSAYGFLQKCLRAPIAWLAVLSL